VVQSATFKGNGTQAFQAVPIILGPGGTINFEYALSSEAFWNPSTLTATSDFLHTAVLTGLTVALDQAGTIPVADVTFVSASGVLYTTAGTVPEPAAVILIGSGLLLIVARKRGRFETAARRSHSAIESRQAAAAGLKVYPESNGTILGQLRGT
jgi:hypothetical protein